MDRGSWLSTDLSRSITDITELRARRENPNLQPTFTQKRRKRRRFAKAALLFFSLMIFMIWWLWFFLFMIYNLNNKSHISSNPVISFRVGSLETHTLPSSTRFWFCYSSSKLIAIKIRYFNISFHSVPDVDVNSVSVSATNYHTLHPLNSLFYFRLHLFILSSHS